MKHNILLFISILLISLSVHAQEGLIPDTKKILDSIVMYDYSSQNDSIRISKTLFTSYGGGVHKSIEYFKWFENSQEWLHDYALLHNRIDLYFDDEGNFLRETKHLWNSSDSTYVKLIETNWNIDSEERLYYEYQETRDMEGNTLRGYYKNYEYNDDGYLIFENRCEWVVNTINWRGKFQHEYAYDAGGNKVLHIEYGWDPVSREWQPDLKEEWDYLSSRSQDSYIKYLWNNNINNWVNSSKWTRSIAGLTDWQTEICHVWSPADSAWVLDRKKERIYDISGIWTSEKTYDWSVLKNDWVNAAWQERGLDNNSYLVLDIIYVWEPTTNEWEGYDKKEMDYDASGNQTSVIKYAWNTEGSNWLNHSRTMRYFDPSQNKVGEESYQWDAVSAEWTGSRKSTWDFDADNDIIVLSESDWVSSEIWDLNAKSFYYYQHTSSFHPILVKNDILIYPNPTSGIINIEGLASPATIKIYTIDGHLIKNIPLVKNNIDISGLPPGTYIMLIKTQTLKFIITR